MVNTCPSCQSTEIEYDSAQGNSVCIRCGMVVEENAVVAEVSFAEMGNGASVLEGQFISAERGKSSMPTIFGRRVGDIGSSKVAGSSAAGILGSSTTTKDSTASGVAGSGDAETALADGFLLAGSGQDHDGLLAEKAGPSMESREMTLSNGRRRIQALATAVGLSGEHYVDAAQRWYALALNHQFTRGRRGQNVIAACLYIVCRQEKTPHMLLDFADVLSTSVYSLGGTFLRLVRLLNLEIPIIDPSFFVARFAARLDFGDRTLQVANTAMRVVARMKRDWIQTGRRPAGVCAAGLIIAARLHGFRRTEAEVVRVVRVCESTLKKRLEEFGRTPSSSLTPEEFEGIWLEQEADPPSFSRNRQKEATAADSLDGEQIDDEDEQFEYNNQSDPTTAFVLPENHLSETPKEEEMALKDRPLEEYDDELEMHLLDAEEIALKTRLWTEMNRDYLEREAEKAAIAASNEQLAESSANQQQQQTDKSKRSTTGSNLMTGGEDQEMAKENVSDSMPVVKKKRAKRNIMSKDAPPAASAAEATRAVLQTKRMSKKINYDALEELFPTPSHTPTQ